MSEQTSDRACATCMHFDPAPSPETEGLCRRYAPRPERENADEIQIDWPVVYRHDWCGEHRAVEVKS